MTEDKIVLDKMSFYAYHGFLAEERVLGQEFKVTSEMYLSLAEAGEEDDLKKTVNYAAIYSDISTVMTGGPYLLLETLAEKIAAVVLAYTRVETVRVEVEKTKPPLPGVMEGVKVCILRKKK